MVRYSSDLPRHAVSRRSAIIATVLRLGTVVLLLASPVDAAETPPPEAGATEITLGKALKILDSREIPEKISAKAGYIVRRYQKKDSADLQRTIKSVKHALEKAREMRIKNDRKFGIEPNIDALKAADEQTLKELTEELRGRHQQDTTTYAARFYQVDQKWREERMPLPNDATLPELVKRVQEEGFHPNLIKCWNGTQTATLKRPLDKKEQPSAKEYRDHGYAVLSDEQPEPPAVFKRPQPVLTDEIVAKFKKAGYTIKAYRRRGKHNDLLIKMKSSNLNPLGKTFGSHGAADLSLIQSTSNVMRFHGEFNFSLVQSTLKSNETIVHSERNTDYVRTASGMYLPKSLLLETRSPGSGKVQFRIEYLAFEQPETDVTFDPSFFDLAQTNEFQSLPLDNLSPRSPSPVKR